VLCNHLGFQSHAERLHGLKDQLAVSGHLTVAEVIEGGDDAVRSEVRLKEVFRRNPATVAVYNVGAGNRGVVGAIKADILPRRPLFIGHELTHFTHVSLREGSMTLTIDQSPELQAQFALEVLLNHYGFEGATDLSPPYASTVPIVLYGPQNLPDSLPG
jgi:LacI family transcriptional regulator